MNVVYRRISHELKLISMAGETYFRVYLDPSNMLNVHFTFLGPSDSPFSKGYTTGSFIFHKTTPTSLLKLSS